MKNSTKPSNVSRKLSTAKVGDESLQALRVRTWYLDVVGRAIPEALAECSRIQTAYVLTETIQIDLVRLLGKQLQAWVDQRRDTLAQSEFGDVLTLLERNGDYLLGRVTPSAVTLHAFDTLLPGTRAVHDVGPYNLPLWSVLAQDLGACKRYVDSQQPPHTTEVELRFEHRTQRFVDALTSMAHLVDIRNLPYLGQPATFPHPIWDTHVDRHFFHSDIAQKDQTVSAYPVVAPAIVGILAMWMLALDRKEGWRLELEWVLMGLCRGVIAYHFTDDLQSHVLGLLRQHGTQIDNELKASEDVAPFDERWLLDQKLGF